MAKKIKGTGRSGDIIHKSLEMSKEEGHKCVSKIWYDTTISLDDGIDKVMQAERERQDILCPLKHMVPSISEDGKAGFEYVDGRFFTPSPYAWQRIAIWYGMPSHLPRFLMTNVENKLPERSITRGKVDSELLISFLRRQSKILDPEKQFMFRTYSDNTMRTMVSDKYAIINNGWYLETLKELFDSMGKTEEPRLSHWRGDEDTMFGNLLIPDTVREEDDSDYGGMLSLSNCEIGRRVWSQRPSVFRAICCNGCIWDRTFGEILKKRHVGDIVLADLRVSLLKNLNEQIPLLASGIDRFLATKDKKIEEKIPMANIFAVLASVGKFSIGTNSQIGRISDQYVEHESDHKNLFGLINSITRAGQSYSPDEWVRFDEVAGSLMAYNDNQWNSFNARAKAVSSKELQKTFPALAV